MKRLFLLLTSSFTTALAVGPLASPPAGPLRGTLQGDLAVWQGIPYAQPPVGPLRWRAPQPLAAWTSEREATQPGNICLQPVRGKKELRGAEDCLYLNVYAPQGARQLPVMVWIHGGGYQTGAGSNFNPSTLAGEQQVVVVTVNYRLGALGFLAASGLEQGGAVGNYGLQDQQMALKWVRQNIAAFGGDPRNVTAFGESAGGMSVCQQLSMPGAQGLFDKAIIQSGPCTVAGFTVTRSDALKTGAKVARALGCQPEDAECLRRLPAEQIVSVQPKNAGALPFAPLWGDASLPQNPAQAAMPLPLIIGSNRDEMRAFGAFIGHPERDLTLGEYLAANALLNKSYALSTLFSYAAGRYPTRTLALAAASTDRIFACPSNDLARARSTLAPVYSYEYQDENVPGKFKATAGIPKLGAFHAAEVASVMGASDSAVNYAAFSPEQLWLARQMRSYWANFARSGNPNGSGLAQWPAQDQSGLEVLALAPQGITLDKQFRSAHQCDSLWRR